MEPVSIYGIAAGGIFLLFFSYRASAYISRWIQDRTLFYVFKYLVYPILFPRTVLSQPFSRWQAFLMIVYWSGTAVCNLIGVDNAAQAGNRAGALAVLHLIPLLCTNRPAFAADLLGISSQTYMRLHASFGIMALLQTLIHTIISISHNAWNVKEGVQLYGLMVRLVNAALGYSR